MGTWIEFRCENRAEASSEGRGPQVGDRCLSHDNVGLMDMANDTRESLLETMRMLEEEARDDGWKKTRAGWICKYCVNAMKAEGND